MRVYFVCHANLATGGTELLHQFSHFLTNNGIENYMVYPNTDGIHCPTPPSFLKYGVKYVSRYIDTPDSILVLAETQIHLVDECQKGTAMIWWLSVDNYVHAYRERIIDNNFDIFNLKERKNLIHFVQSYYAKDFLQDCLGIRDCHFLMDYINDDIVEWARVHKDAYQRENICLYNPKKGYNILEPIIKASSPDITWIPLINMSPTEMADTMCKAKLYIDFGSHPGKDRIPREAATCGCCILTNRQGSAAYQNDVNIPERYKIAYPNDIDSVLERIYDLLDNYHERIIEYGPYRDTILQEKEGFFNDAQKASSLLQHMASEKRLTMSTSELLRHVELLDFIGSASDKINELTEQAKISCHSGNSSKVMNELLDIDYILQLIRETIYLETEDFR